MGIRGCRWWEQVDIAHAGETDGGGLHGNTIQSVNSKKRGSSTIANGGEWRGSARLTEQYQSVASQLPMCTALPCLPQVSQAGKHCRALLQLGGRWSSWAVSGCTAPVELS